MPNHADLVEVFARTVARRASHVAVEGPEGMLTYGELDKRSNQLANRLRSLGVENESRVGISLPRGALELLTMLATVKAGGAYVPLDPSHPEDRLRGILKDAEPQVMVVHPGSALASASEGHTLILDSIDGATNGQDRTPLVTQVTPSQLVYILFTSGSTGRPKGVEITRGALANFLGSMARTPGMAEHERLLALNWLLQRPTVARVIIGARDEAQLSDNLGAVGWSLTASQVARLDAASATTPIYPYWHQWQFKERNPTPVG